MSAPLRGRTLSRIRRPGVVLVSALALASGGCAGLFGSYDVAPNGQRSTDADLRRMLTTRTYDEALETVGDDAPDDELLRLMYRGIVHHYAGDYASSARAMDRAEMLARDRVTTSLSKSALSMLASDRSLDYEPGMTERLMLHYYAMLDFLEQRDVEGAAVEARRLGHLLDLAEDDGESVAADQRATFALLHYLSGAVFEMAGEANAAGVSYRRAAALGGVAATTGSAPADSMGEVLVVVERGFVAHLVEDAVLVSLASDELDVLTGDDEDARAELSTGIAHRVLNAMAPDAEGDSDAQSALRSGASASDIAIRQATVRKPHRPRSTARSGGNGQVRPDQDRHEDDDDGEDDDEDESLMPYLLKVAWPAYRRDWRPRGRAVITTSRAGNAMPGPSRSAPGTSAGGPAHASVGSATTEAGDTAPVRFRADLSDAVARDFAEDRTARLARMIARGAAKFALSKKAEKEAGEEDELLGTIVGLLTNVGGVLLEQADTRSWHLLPGEIGIVRLHLPAGQHTLAVDVEDGVGRRASRTVSFGNVTVRPGELTVVSKRVWR